MTPAWSTPRLLPLLLVMLTASTSADLDVASRLINVSAVEGQTAELPCDVTPPLAGDELRLVLWYHGTGGTPIYTYDARGRKTLRGEHWVDSSLDRTRVQFQPDAQPAHLRVTGVERADQRLYRCRVDFLHSPTRNSRVNLTVIVPPEPPVMYDDSGRLIRNRAGPFREGQTVTITCVTGGGSPSPNVTWWSGNALLDGSWQGSADGAVRNQLTLGPLTRADLGAEYTCWATNHVLSPPRSTTFSIDLLLRPLTVNMLGVNKPLSAGTTYQLTCESSGSRPAAAITWWLGNHKLQHAREERVSNSNITRSVLSFTPDLEALGQQIRCTAENHKLRRATPLQQSWPLTIQYKPRPTLRLWSAMQDRGIRQGDDVFMKCDVRADPPITSIRWKFQSRPIGLYPHLSADISNGSLVLREVTTRATGKYSCEATNAEGTVESNRATLEVQVLPVCSTDRTVTVQAARGETVNVTCSVSANPEPFRYTWALNASGAVSDVPEAQVTSAGLTSVVSFSPRSQLDFGTLLCWADNLLGRQRQPCRIKLVLAEKPGPLHNCSVLNRTTASLETVCQAGFHGGMQQWFGIMVRDTVTQEMVANRSSALPRFHVGDLQEGRNYSITMYAYNDRGRGRLHRMKLTTLTTPAEADEMTGSLSSLFRMTPILGILIGIVGTLVLLAIAIVVTMRLRGHNDAKEGYPASVPPEKEAPGSAACHIPANPDLLTVKIDDIDDPEERYMAERLINRPPLDLPRKFSSRSPPPNSTYCSLGRGEYTRVPSPKMPVYQGPYFSLPRESGQRSCSSEASEGRYDPAHSHSGHSDSSTLEEAAPLMSDRRESVV